MSVRDRLKRLTHEDKSPPAADERQQQIDDLRRRIAQILERRPGQVPMAKSEPRPAPLQLSTVTSGEEVPTRFGPIYVATGLVDAGAFYGRRRIREMTMLDMHAAAILAGDAKLHEFTFSDALFLDTETTGLAGGTGTLAFLIGLGWYEDQGFVTRQLFARDFSEEPAALALLADWAGKKRFLVTFNGKSFDVGLLSSRFVLNRQRDALGEMPHLDLLHPARRLFAHRLDDARLGTLEEEVLGVHRKGDVPGSEIPQRYFDWLRYRDGRLMADVLEHNRLDVVSMAMLLVHMAELVERGHEAEEPHVGDLLAAARMQLDRGDIDRGQELIARLVEQCEGETAREAGRLLSLLYRRAGRWSEATQLWEKMLQDDPGDLFAIEELAKWCEHRERDFRRAIELVDRALTDPRHQEKETRARLEYRRIRLQRRVGKEGWGTI